MEIKCKVSRRFLLKIDTDKFYKTIDDLLKTKVEVPITIEIPCKKCGMIEVYDIYKSHYVHKKSYKRQ